MSYSVIIKLIYSVAYKLTMKQENVQRKVGEMMVGKVLDLPEIRIYKQAKAEDEAIIKGLEEKNRSLEDEVKMLREENARLRSGQVVNV